MCKIKHVKDLLYLAPLAEQDCRGEMFRLKWRWPNSFAVLCLKGQ